MAKYLVHGRYTTEGLRGLAKDGGTGRRAAVEQALKSLGGKLESFYYAFGETDAYLIVELPDHASALAFALVAGGSGMVTASTTVLVTPEEMDAAAKKSVSYRPPGK